MKLNKKIIAVIIMVAMVFECLPMKIIAQTVKNNDIVVKKSTKNLIFEEEQKKEEEKRHLFSNFYSMSDVVSPNEFTDINIEKSNVEESKYETVNDIKMSFKDGVLTFSGSGEIGKKYDLGEDLEPEETRAWDIYKDSAEKIVFEEGITGINEYAFSNFKNVKELSFSNSIKNIRECAFNNCVSIEEVVLPDDMFYFGGSVFNNCSSLKTLTIGRLQDSFDLWLPFLTGCPNLENIVVLEPNVGFKVKDGVLFDAFYNLLILYPAGKKDKKYEIPSGVTEIAMGAFSGNNYLEEIIIPDTIKMIYEFAFEYCPSLKYLSFPDSVEFFYDPNPGWTGVNSEGKEAVLLCNNLQYIENNSKAKLFLEDNFGKDHEKYWINKENGKIVPYISNGTVIPKSLGKRLNKSQIITIDGICYKCVEEADEQQAIELYNDGKTVGTLEIMSAPDNFVYSPILEYGGWKYTVNPRKDISVEFNNSTLTFRGTGLILYSEKEKWKPYEESAEKIIFEEGISGIESYSFTNFQNVKEIIFPNSLKRIENNAFDRCFSLREIALPDNMTYLGTDIFANCKNLKKIIIGKQEENAELTYINNWIGFCESLEDIIVAQDNFVFEIIDNVLFDKRTHELIAYLSGKKEKIYIIPDGMKEIGQKAFHNAYIEQIIIPDTVTTINQWSFFGCDALKSISFPTSIKWFLGNNIVYYCDAIEVIENKSKATLELSLREQENTVKMWKDNSTNMLVSSITNGKVTAELFNTVPKRGEKITYDGVVYKCLEGIESLISDDDPSAFHKLMERYNAGKSVGVLEVMSVSSDKELKDTVIYGGWQYDVKIPEIFIGDVDNSSKVDVNDALIVLKIAAGLITPTKEQNKAADIDGNGTINSGDALLILKYAAGLITEL